MKSIPRLRFQIQSLKDALSALNENPLGDAIFVLILLAEFKELTVKQLSEKMPYTASAISKWLKRLEKQKLVHRQQQPLDFRVYVFTLSPWGIKAVQSHLRIEKAIEKNLFKNTHPRTKKQFFTQLNNVFLNAHKIQKNELDKKSKLLL